MWQMAPSQMNSEMKYTVAVGIDSVQIALLLAQLNSLQVLCRWHILCLPTVTVQREGLHNCWPGIWSQTTRESPCDEQEHLQTALSKCILPQTLCTGTLQDCFEPSHADPALRMKDCKTHYKYVAIWVDNILVMSKEPLKVIQEFKEAEEYKLKVDNYTCYKTHAKTYITCITDKLKKLMEWSLRSYMSPKDPNYSLELDKTPLLGPQQHSQYRMIIGSLNWLVTLRRYSIYHPASTMARYRMAPQEGHLSATKRILGYLRAYLKISIWYDTQMPDFTMYKTPTCNWFCSYPEAQEALPHNMPKPCGQPAKLWGYFNASHASCLKTQQSVTGIPLFINSCPIHWYCKRQNTVETSTYGSELIAGRIAMESIIDFRYRLKMLGVPIKGSLLLFGDNQSMIMNTTVPSSALKKRHSAVAYHCIREAVACSIVKIIHCCFRQILAIYSSNHLVHKRSRGLWNMSNFLWD